MQRWWSPWRFLLIGLLLCGTMAKTRPAHADAENGYTQREIAWHLGERVYVVLGARLSEAVKTGPMPDIANHRAILRQLASAAGVGIPPMPRYTGRARQFARAVVDWERTGAGSSLRRDLARKHGADVGALFELAYSTYWLLTMDDFASARAAPFVSQMRRSFVVSRLDPKLLQPVLQRIDRKSKAFDVHMALQRFQGAARVTLKRERGQRIRIGPARPPPPRADIPWALGYSTCLAALQHIKAEVLGKRSDLFGEIMDTVRTACRRLDVPAPQFPKRGQQAPAAFQMRITTYVLSTWGPVVVNKLRNRHGPRYAYLFEIPLKAGWIAQGGPAASNEMARMVANFIKGVAEEAELPRKVWGPFVTAADLGQEGKPIQDALQAMNYAALAHLGNTAAKPGPGTQPRGPTVPELDAKAAEAAIAYWNLGRDLMIGIDRENKSITRGGRPGAWPPLEARVRELGLRWPAWPAAMRLAGAAQQAQMRIRHVMNTVTDALQKQIEKRDSRWHNILFQASYKLGLFTLAYEQKGYQADVAKIGEGQLRETGLPEKLWSNVFAGARQRISGQAMILRATLAHGAVLNHLKSLRPGVAADAAAPAGARAVITLVQACFDWAHAAHRAANAEQGRAEGLARYAKARKDAADQAAAQLGITLKWPIAVQNTRYKDYGTFHHVAGFCVKDLEKAGKSALGRICGFTEELQYFRLGSDMGAVLQKLRYYLGPKKPLAQRQVEALQRMGPEAGVPQFVYEALVARAKRGESPGALVEAAMQANQRLATWASPGKR